MFSIFKFFYLVIKAFPSLLHIDRNALQHVPDQSKYLAMIMLSCFWCLAFGLFAGELFFIGYNMFGHVAVITMVFVTWWTFRNLTKSKGRGVDYLRMPDRSSRCDEYNDTERDKLAARLLVTVKV